MQLFESGMRSKMENQFEEAKSLLERSLLSRKSIMHPYNAILIQNLDSLMSLCIDMKDWNSAKKYAKKLLKKLIGKKEL